MNIKMFFSLFAAVFLSASLFGQTAEELDRMLELEKINAAQAARFVLGAANLLPENLSGGDAEKAAFAMALEKGWVAGNPVDAVLLKDASLMIMQAFGFKGGILYSIFHNRRYAHRELVYKKIIQGRSDPDLSVSGPRLLQIIGVALSYSGENERIDALLMQDDTQNITEDKAR